MKYVRRCKGAVTIFLVIILVPMLTCSAFFVDVSRISLARGVVASAGDLALNTALTQYDSQLKELYGLFATTQDQESLFRDLEAFYHKSIVSYGVSSDVAGPITDQIMAQLRDLPSDVSDASDILNMKLGDFNAYIPQNGSLTNPDILERQIVEFMKYRTPINTGLRFLSALNSFSSVSKETKLVEQRQSYYKEEEKLNKKLRSAWENLAEYNSLVKSHLVGVANDTFFTDLESRFKDFHVRTIKDLYETRMTAVTPIQLTERTTLIPDAFGGETEGKLWELESRGERYKTFVDLFPGDYNLILRPSLVVMQQWIVEMGALYNDDKLTEIKTKLKSLGLPTSSVIDEGLYNIQYVRQLLETSGQPLKEYTDQMTHRYERYQEFAVAMIWADDDALDFYVKYKGKEIHATELAKTIKANYEEDMRLTHDAFQPLAELTTKIRTSGRTDPFTINGEIGKVAEKARVYRDKFKEAVECLKRAEKDLKDVYDSLNGGDLVKRRNEWNKTSQDPDLKLSSLAEQDRADLKDLKTNYDKDQVLELYNRISPLRQRMEQISEQIEQIRYAGKFVGDIKDYETFEKLLADRLGKEFLDKRSQYKQPLQESAESSFNGLFVSPDIDFTWMKNPETGISLYGSYQPVFYVYLFKKHSDPKEADETKRHCTVRSDKDDKAKKLQDRMKNNGEKATDEEKNEKVKEEKDPPKKDGDGQSVKDLPSKPSGDSSSSTAHGTYTSDSNDVAKSTSTGLAGMFSGVAGILKGSSEDLRDGYYVTDYILSMFSFDTIEKEHKDKDLKTPIQTLRCHEINGENNYHYKREVEYILYGGTGSSNVTHAYSSIFAIRFGLNVIYAFTDMDTSMFALQIATPISAATWGIVPVPLIQATIQILLALVQSAIDLGNLARGKAVPVFHKKSSWVVTPAGLMAAAKEEASDLLKGAADEAVNWAADKLGEYLDKGGEEADQFLDENREEIENHISESIDDLISRHANVAIKKMISLIQNALGDPSITDPGKYVSEKLDEWLQSLDEDPSDISYIVKEKTVELLKEKYINSSIDKLREIEQQGMEDLESFTEKMDEYFNEISNAVKNKLHEATDEIKKYKNEMMDKVREAMDEGAEELKTELEQGIDGFFGTEGQSGGEGESKQSSGESTGMSSLLSFRYSDYMRLFLLLGMFTNRTSILLRTADVIQLNVSKVTGNPDYLLRNAGAYLTVEAKVLVKPVLMPLPLFADTFRDPLENTSWYSIDYNATRGY